MSTRKLLISAAAAALMAGSASALGVAAGDADGATTAFTPSASIVYYGATAFVAEEASFAVTGSENGIFELTVSSTGTFAASENYFVDVTVSGGTFFSTLTGAEVTDGGGGAPVTVSGASVQIAGQAQTGQIGENAVRFLVSNSPVEGNNFGLELPIAYSGCPSDLNVTISIQTSGGVTFEEGTVSMTTPYLQCANAYQATISTDVVAGAHDSFLSSTAFTDFEVGTTTTATDANSDGTLTGPVADTASTASLGVVTVAFDPGGVAASYITSLASPATTVTGAAGEMDDVDFNVNIADTTGITSADTQEGGDSSAFTAGVAALNVPAGTATTVNNIVDNITVDVNGTDQVAQQGVTTSGGVLNFLDATLIASEAVADATLDDLNYEGETCGTFDWVGDATKPTQNIFRVTGFGSSVTNVIATLSNSSEGINGSMTLTQPYDFSAPELVVTAAHLTDVFGEFGRADVLLNFIGSSTSLDCDRLMNSDAANIITPFGNKNQAAAAGDDGDDD